MGINHCVYKLATAVAMAKDFTGHVQVIFTDERTKREYQCRLMQILGMIEVDRKRICNSKGKFEVVILYKKETQLSLSQVEKAVDEMGKILDEDLSNKDFD